MLGESTQMAYEFPNKPEMPADTGGDLEEQPEILYADIYAGNEDIQAITIPKEVALIEDGAFEGCSRLQAIILENEQPSEIRPGQGLLRGTDADIYVKDKVLPDYRLNYFWSMYAGRIKAQSTLEK